MRTKSVLAASKHVPLRKGNKKYEFLSDTDRRKQSNYRQNWRAFSLSVARIAFAPERSKGANHATGHTKQLYVRQKSCD